MKTKEQFLQENKSNMYKDEILFTTIRMNPSCADRMSEVVRRKIVGYIVNGVYNAPLNISDEAKELINLTAKTEYGYNKNIYDDNAASTEDFEVQKPVENKPVKTSSPKAEETKVEKISVEDIDVVSTETGLPIKEDKMVFDTKSSFIPDKKEETPVIVKTEDTEKKKTAISFDYNKMVIEYKTTEEERKLNKTIQNQIANIDAVLNGFIPKGLKHEYNPLSTGMIELNLFKNKTFIASFVIDPNVVHGNGYYIIANSQNGPVMVPLQLSVVANVIKGDGEGGNYTLTDKEVKEAVSGLFEDTNVYTYIDMSGDKLKDISSEDYKTLGRNLTSILKTYSAGSVTIPRFKFKVYKSPAEFTLISNESCKAPLPGMTNVVTGEEIKFLNGNFILKNAAGVVVTTKIQ